MEYDDKDKYDTDAVKFRLIEYREREKDIDNQTERLDRLEMKILNVGSPVLSDMPKALTSPQDRTAALIADKIDLENDIREAIAEQRREKEALEIILRKLRHSEERAVIRMRYFDGASWNEVSDMLFGGKADFLGKEDTYLRRTHKIHGSALLNMAIIIQGGK